MRPIQKAAVLFALLVILPCALSAAGDPKLIRDPDLSPDGKQIAFSFQGDIWTASTDGTDALRLTVHEGYEAYPRWSPDGDYIAFSSNRFGSYDVFSVPRRGGIAKRLTWRSGDDRVTDWNGRFGILFSTRRDYRQVDWEYEIYRVSPDGGTPSRLLGALGDMAVTSPSGRYTAIVKGACRVEREYYNGPANRQIWVYDHEKDSYIQVTTSASQDILPRWGDDETLYYLSASPGNYNIFYARISQDGDVSDPVQVTSFEGDGVRWFDVSVPGGIIVAEYKTGIYSMGLDGSGMKEIVFDFGADYRFDPIEHETYTADVDEYSVSPNGKYSAVVIHGEIFITENSKKKDRTVDVSDSPARDTDPVWTSDTTLVFLSDREGQNDLWFVRSADPEESDLFKTLKRETIRMTRTSEDESELALSPDGKMISFLRGLGSLVVAEVSPEGKLSGEKVLLDGWSTPRGVAWSPDGKWLAYSLEDLYFNSEIYIQPVDGSKDPVNVSMHPRSDFDPVWSPDGSKLGFVSNRNNQDFDIWFAWLTRADWEKTPQDWEEAESDDNLAVDNFSIDGKKDHAAARKSKDDGKGEDEKKPEPLKIDFKDIHERLVQVTTLPGDERGVSISKDGKTFYFTAPGSAGKGTDLFSIKWDGKDLKEITHGGQNPSGLAFDPAGAYLYFVNRGKVSRLKSGTDKVEGIAHRAQLTIDYHRELDQIFEEAWRTLNNWFYDPNFHGKDWTALKNKYKPWAMMASTKHDFRDIFNIMAGQLDASHMGLYGRDRAKTQRETTGLLGVEIKPVKGGVEILRVIPGSPADRTVSTLHAGEVITAVDGVPVGKDVNFYSLLVDKDGTRILLSVKDEKGKNREVAIRPVDDLRDQLYDEWVKSNRSMTEKLSKGRLGYLHIQAMGWKSFERFEREFAAAGNGKEGIVIDVRFNGGGWTTDYLMTVLNVKQHAYTIPRGAAADLKKDNSKFKDYYPYAERLPFFPWMKPSIALCNEMSYSNAEIFSHAYKTLGIGTLVGEPTFGAVISTDGKRLIDGSLIRLPFRAWYVRATGENMEHGPAVPDIIVENPPDSKAEGSDPQLERAVKELLEEIDSSK